MSASDAAPLPRLGEVFFDVRGNSRSMRLSWYADTGVAVLSIWQGGICTGTFRLAIADLPRMVATLQRGPGGPRPEWDSEAPGQTFAQVPRVATGQVEVMDPLSGQDRAGPDYRTGPASYDTQYPTEAPGGPRTGEPPGHRTAPPSHRRPVPPVPSAPPEYLPAPPDRHGGSADHAAGLPDHTAGPGRYQAQPPDHRTGYLADLPGADQAGPAGYDRVPDAGRHSGAWNPGAGVDAPYPRGSHGEAGYPDPLAGDPYLGDTGPADYQDSPYPPGPPAPGPGDVPAPGAADYPTSYGEAVTDDILTGPTPVPYDRPSGRHGAASRHAPPDVPSG